MKSIVNKNSVIESSVVPLSNRNFGVRAGLKLSHVKQTDTPTLEFIASDQTLDRAGEIIRPEGWLLDRYRQNPVFQNAHQYGDVIFTIGRSEEIEVRHNRSDGTPYLYQRVRFAIEENPFARIAYGLYRGGFLNAVSVGFLPIRWLDGREARPARRIYIEQELVEVSAVAIPSNHNALIILAKSGTAKLDDIEACREMLRTMLAAYESSKSKRMGEENTSTSGYPEFRSTGQFRYQPDRSIIPTQNPWRRLRLMFTALTEALNKINAE